MNSILYRCGWCGSTTDEKGNYLHGPTRKKAERIISTYGDSHTVLTHGECGGGTHESERVQVTREMALDAGMPEMEGTWINWP